MANESTYHRIEANIYPIECRSRGKAGGDSSLEGLRNQEAERAIGKKKGWSRFIARPSEH
jgi:hypothetical protein